MINVKYTEWCSTFISTDRVVFWDEIEDTRIQEIFISSIEEGVAIMNEWKNNAPKDCICEILRWKV